MENGTKDLTQGNLLKTLLLFAFPYIVANFLQALYGATDIFVTGHFCKSSTVSAVALSSYLMQTITFLSTGFTVSATILIGNYFGAKKYDDIQKIINTTLYIFTIFSLIMTFLLLFFASDLLSLLKTPPEAIEEAISYTRYCAFGIIFIVFFNLISSILRGVGNSTAPMVFVGISSFLNLILNVILIGYFNLGAVGAALATVISQAVSVTIAILYIKRGNFVFSIKFRHIKYYKEIAMRIFKLGLPLSLQDTIMPISFMVLYTLSNSMGVAESAAYGTITRLNAFLMLPAGSFAMALTVVAAQNMGAQKFDRAYRALGYSISVSFFFGIVFFIWQQVIPESAVSIFSKDTSIIDAGSDFLRSFSYDYLLVPFVFCLHGFLNGLGRTMFSSVNNTIGAFLIRIPAGFYFGTMAGATLFNIGIAAPLTSVITITSAGIYILALKKKNKLFSTMP
ncbi:MATE family efflux transporter [bacterium]|nr:MATE family efflux transporter [bacterium]